MFVIIILLYLIILALLPYKCSIQQVKRLSHCEHFAKSLYKMIMTFRFKRIKKGVQYPYCNDNLIYVFLFWELRDLTPNFHIHVSVEDLYITRIGPHISC